MTAKDQPRIVSFADRLDAGLGARSAAHIESDDPFTVVGVVVHAAPVDDRGHPHIVEHLVCETVRRNPTFWLDYLKGVTGRDHVAYLIGSRRPEGTWAALEALIAALDDPHVDDALFARLVTGPPTGEVVVEVGTTTQRPAALQRQAMARILYPDSCFGLVSGGNPDAMATLERRDIVDYLRDVHRGADISVFHHGPTDLDAVVAAMSTRLRRCVATPSTAIASAPAPPPQGCSTVVVRGGEHHSASVAVRTDVVPGTAAAAALTALHAAVFPPLARRTGRPSEVLGSSSLHGVHESFRPAAAAVGLDSTAPVAPETICAFVERQLDRRPDTAERARDLHARKRINPEVWLSTEPRGVTAFWSVLPALCHGDLSRSFDDAAVFDAIADPSVMGELYALCEPAGRKVILTEPAVLSGGGIR